MISCSPAAESDVHGILKSNAEKCVLKSKTVRKNLTELTYEIRLKSDDTSFINDVTDIVDVESAVLVTYNGEYM